LFSGSPEQIVEDIHALRALGVSAIDFNFLGSTVEKVLEQMEGFRASVMERI
jgi:alkanesulfonate monooxygenase SsuD/methylene tetrahydromethanopterin reductase-like flavin-dependent oxidoreductase (luciferase family)